MPTPEVYTITDSDLARNKTVFIKLLTSMDCICEHSAFYHHYSEYIEPLIASTSYAFKNCITGGCECAVFKRDNLKYLENLSR